MKFDKSKVISKENIEKAVIGKMYLYGDFENELQLAVMIGNVNSIGTLTDINANNESHPYLIDRKFHYGFIYPIEEGVEKPITFPTNMTLRDYFAIHASPKDIDRFETIMVTREEARYMFADAMLKERRNEY